MGLQTLKIGGKIKGHAHPKPDFREKTGSSQNQGQFDNETQEPEEDDSVRNVFAKRRLLAHRHLPREEPAVPTQPQVLHAL